MPDAPALHILILAAGASSRMRGADKLLEPVDGIPQLTRIAMAALTIQAPVWVALAPDRPARITALAALQVHKLTVAAPHLGLSASMTAGLSVIPPDAALMLLLADLPEIDAADLATMLHAQQTFPQDILRATDQSGHHGHPVIFPPWAREGLSGLTGDSGAKAFLAAHANQSRAIPLPGAHATTDLDTPEDWAEWRSKTGR